MLISPSGTPVLSTAALRQSEVDIFAYQDAVGSGYLPYQNTFDPERRIAMLDEAFAKYAAAHRDAGKHNWGNLETWQMSGPDYNNAFPADFSRVQRQIDIQCRHVDVITAYALGGFMEPPNSSVRLGGERAVKLFNDYRRYLSQQAESRTANASESPP